MWKSAKLWTIYLFLGLFIFCISANVKSHNHYISHIKNVQNSRTLQKKNRSNKLLNSKSEEKNSIPKMLSQSYGIDPLQNIWYVDKIFNKIHVIDTSLHQEKNISNTVWNTWSKSSTYPSKFENQGSNFQLWLPQRSRIMRFLSVSFYGHGNSNILLQTEYDPTTSFEYIPNPTQNYNYNNYQIAFWTGTFDKNYQNFNWKLICVPQLETWITSVPYGVNPSSQKNYHQISPNFLFLVNKSFINENKVSFSCFACDDLGYPSQKKYLGKYFIFSPTNQDNFFPQLLSSQDNSKVFPISLSPKDFLFDSASSRFDYINHIDNQNVQLNSIIDNRFYNVTSEINNKNYLFFTSNGLFEASPSNYGSSSWKISNISNKKNYDKFTNFYSAYYVNNQLYVIAKNTPDNIPGAAKLFSINAKNNDSTLIDSISEKQFQNSNAILRIKGYTYLLSIKNGANNQRIEYQILHLHNSTWRKAIAIILLIIGCLLILAILITWAYITISAYNSRLYMHTKNFASTHAAQLLKEPELYVSGGFNNKRNKE